VITATFIKSYALTRSLYSKMGLSAHSQHIHSRKYDGHIYLLLCFDDPREGKSSSFIRLKATAGTK
jgi:hypothetical protein